MILSKKSPHLFAYIRNLLYLCTQICKYIAEISDFIRRINAEIKLFFRRKNKDYNG